MGGEDGGDGGDGGGAGDRGWGDFSPHQSHHMVTTCAAKVPKSPLNTQFQRFYSGGLLGRGVYWPR